jgi:hypothetical protein
MAFAGSRLRRSNVFAFQSSYSPRPILTSPGRALSPATLTRLPLDRHMRQDFDQIADRNGEFLHWKLDAKGKGENARRDGGITVGAATFATSST